MRQLMIALEKRTLSAKIAMGFVALLLIVVGLGIDSVLRQVQQSRSINDLYQSGVVNLANVKNMQVSFVLIGRQLRQGIIASTAQSRDLALGQLSQQRANLALSIEALSRHSQHADRLALQAQIEKRLTHYLQNVDQVLALVHQDRLAEARAFVGSPEFLQEGIEVGNLMQASSDLIEKSIPDLVDQFQSESSASLRLAVILMIGGVLLGVLAAFLVTRSILRPLSAIRDSVQQIATGKLDCAVPHTGYHNELGELARAIEVLHQEARQMAAQRWIKTSQATIQADLQAATTPVEFARRFLTGLGPLLNLGHAAFYVFEPEHQHLRLLSGYAFRERKGINQFFALGQGLVGECAIERAPILLTDPPEDYIEIGTALGHSPPKAITVLPVLLNERLMAVIELATLNPIGSDQEVLLDGLLPVVAMSLDSLQRALQTQELLEETRQQAEDMERQAVRLEEQTVEMEAQQVAIKETETWFREILESAPDGMLVIDEQATIILANRQVDTMFNYAPGELIGKPLEVLVLEDIRQAHVGWRNLFMHDATKTLANLELRAVSMEGIEFAAEVGLAKLSSVGGRGFCVCVSLRDITEKKRTAQQIDQQRATMSALLDAIPDQIYYKDAAGDYLGCNVAYAQRVGKPLEDILTRTDYDIYPPELAFAMRNADQQVLDALTPRRGEEWVELADGRKRLLDSLRSPFYDSSGTLLGVLNIGRDITEHAQAEQAIRVAAEEQQAIFEAATLGIAFLRDRIVIRANAQLGKLFGRTAEEVIGQSTRTWYPDDAGYITGGDEVYAAMSQGVTHQREQQLIRADGSLFWCRLSGRALDIKDRSRGAVWMLEDITERKQAEGELLLAKQLAQAAQERASTLFNASSSAHVIINELAQIVDCSDGFLRLLDYKTLADVAGKHPAALAPEYQPDGGNSMELGPVNVGIAIERGRHTFDWMCQDAHGVSILVEVTIVPVMLEGKPHLMGIWHDLRSRVEMERTLQKARQVAEEATKAKSDFLANMSHEIRTPMNAIIGMSHLALQTNLDKKQKNYIEKVHRAGENLLGIINDILDFSKIEAGKMTMEQIDFRLEDVMDHLSNLVGLKAEDKGLELMFDLARDMPTALVGDSLRLGQILVNLGNNAVKFTEKGEIIIGGGVVSQTEAEAELHFWVKDSGIGMTPEQCGKMFQSFSQADASTTRKYGGTGLGLVISKNLVELMHGRIWVESEADKGSTFHFHVRLGLQGEPLARRTFHADDLLGVRVLVVDDSASAREILSSMASNFGLEVDVAQDGQSALLMIAHAAQQQLPYDLVLMDWKMPGMDGIETMQRMQQEPIARTPTVIMVTAYGREEAFGHAEQRGVKLKTVLTKPVTQSTLLEAIGEVLGKGDLIETRSEEKAVSYAEAMAKLAGARVLLVEDYVMNQELAMELLGQAGIEVVLANNGQEALDILGKDSKFDGVLMDCQMPVMDGYTATREIRKLPQFAEMPIIAMTANAMAGDREKVINAGMWDHIAKPLNIGEMFGTIAKWIKPSGLVTVDVTEGNPFFGTGGTASEEIPTMGGLPALPGIDIRAGMATAMDREPLYTRMLVKFRDTQSSFAAQFAAARADPDPLAATRAAHTLKGGAGNIGAKSLQAAAGDLEHACKAGKPAEAIEALLQRVLAELAIVMPGLENVGAGEAAASGSKAPAMSEDELQAALARLKALLADSNPDAGELLGELLAQFEGTPLAAQLKPVAIAVEGFDFDAALEKFNAI